MWSRQNRRTGPNVRLSTLALLFLSLLLLTLEAARPAQPVQAQDISQEAHSIFLPVLGSIEQVLPPPQPSLERGLYPRSFRLTLRAPHPRALIYYTLDGREPRPDTGELYLSPIHVDRSLVLRAMALIPPSESTVNPQSLSSEIITHSYILPDSVADQPMQVPGLPAEWGSMPDLPEHGAFAADYGMDMHSKSDAAQRARLREALISLPSMSIAIDPEAMFGSQGIYRHPLERGREWERPISLEWLPAPADRARPEDGTGYVRPAPMAEAIRNCRWGPACAWPASRAGTMG